jgi:hypothetical protein
MPIGFTLFVSIDHPCVNLAGENLANTSEKRFSWVASYTKIYFA